MRCLAGKAVVGLSLAALMMGCMSRTTGNEGNLEFSYVADDDVTDFNKPLAVGAKLEVTVGQAGTHKYVDLKTAESSDDRVLKVLSFSGNKLILEGVAHGGALIEVEAKIPTGEVVSDSVNMLSRVPEVLVLRHTCSSDSEAYYLIDQDIWLSYDMKMKNGQPVIGYGYYPFTVSPQAALTIDQTTRDQAFFHMKTSATAQLVTLNSTIDSTVARMNLVNAGSIDGATLSASGATKVNQINHYQVLPTVGGKPVCQAKTPVSAASLTPDICEVSASGPVSNDADTAKNEQGWIRVNGKAVGTCNFTATYSAAKNGAGHTQQFSVEVTAQ